MKPSPWNLNPRISNLQQQTDYLVANDYPEPRPKSLYRDCGFPSSANTITVLEAHAKDLITWQIPIDPKTGSAAINKTTLQLARRP